MLKDVLYKSLRFNIVIDTVRTTLLHKRDYEAKLFYLQEYCTDSHSTLSPKQRSRIEHLKHELHKIHSWITLLTEDEAFIIGEWTKVIIGAESGYIKSEFLRWGNDQENVQSKQSFVSVKSTNGVNVRSAPSLDAQVDRRLECGNVVTILGETASHWYYVWASDCAGYVSEKHISMTNSMGIPDIAVSDINMNPYDLKLLFVRK